MRFTVEKAEGDTSNKVWCVFAALEHVQPIADLFFPNRGKDWEFEVVTDGDWAQHAPGMNAGQQCWLPEDRTWRIR